MWDNVKSLVTLEKNYSREILHQSISEDQFAVDSTQYSGRIFIIYNVLFRAVKIIPFLIIISNHCIF